MVDRKDGGDNLHVWKGAANILNKQSWTANKKKHVTKCYTGLQTWKDSLA
jgi:hypothetical protein